CTTSFLIFAFMSLTVTPLKSKPDNAESAEERAAHRANQTRALYRGSIDRSHKCPRLAAWLSAFLCSPHPLRYSAPLTLDFVSLQSGNLAQPVIALDLARAQAAHPLVHAWPARHDEHINQFIGRRGAGDVHLHRVEMAAHIARIDVRDRHVEPRPGSAHLLGRRHDRLGAAQHFPHGIAPGHMPQGPVFDLAVAANDRAFAVAFDLLRPNAHCR